MAFSSIIIFLLSTLSFILKLVNTFESNILAQRQSSISFHVSVIVALKHSKATKLIKKMLPTIQNFHLPFIFLRVNTSQILMFDSHMLKKSNK